MKSVHCQYNFIVFVSYKARNGVHIEKFIPCVSIPGAFDIIHRFRYFNDFACCVYNIDFNNKIDLTNIK